MNSESLVTDFYKPVYRYCVFLTGSVSEAEDITQEVFIRASQQLATLKNREAAQAWLFSIARNHIFDLRRRGKRWLLRAMWLRESLPKTSEANPELRMTLLKLLQALPRRQREVFVLRHLHDLSTEETAQQLKLDMGTVKSHLKRAVDKLRAALEDNPGFDSNVFYARE